MFFENLRRCFSINLNEYENIGINLEINKVLLLAFVIFGALGAILMISRKNMRDLVLQLMRREVYSAEEALTLEELGFKDNRIVMYLILHSEIMRKIVLRADRVEYSYEEYKKLTKEQRRDVEHVDFLTARFYINESEMDRARHIKEKYVVDNSRMIIGGVFLVVLYILVAAVMPEILTLINGILK